MAWARSGATIIEFFPIGSFIRDYETIATALGHRHFAVWNDTVLGKDRYMQFQGETEPNRLHDGTLTELDPEFIHGLMEKIISRMIG